MVFLSGPNRTQAYKIEFEDDWSSVEKRWQILARQGFVLPFQNIIWLRTWYETLGRRRNISPLVTMISEADTGQDVMAIPLIVNREDGLARIEFADLDITDYNAPVLGKNAPNSRPEAVCFWHDLHSALTSIDGPRADLISFRKMPEFIKGRANPLTLLEKLEPSSLHRNMLSVPGGWEDYRATLKRKFRKELGRSWRLFAQFEGARFVIEKDQRAGAAIMADLEALQSLRISELGLPYLLDDPDYRGFYRQIVENGLKSNEAVVSALTAEGETVAALMGICDGDTFVMLRIAHADGKWLRTGPGRLIIERTMHQLHAKGVRHFDFGIGNYVYKERFRAASHRLSDITVPLSLKGMPATARARLRTFVRQRPQLRALVNRIR